MLLLLLFFLLLGFFFRLLLLLFRWVHFLLCLLFLFWSEGFWIIIELVFLLLRLFDYTRIYNISTLWLLLLINYFFGFFLSWLLFHFLFNLLFCWLLKLGFSLKFLETLLINTQKYLLEVPCPSRTSLRVS